MRILIASRWYIPEKNPRAFRTTELVQELKKREYELDLFLPSNSALIEDEFLHTVVHRIPVIEHCDQLMVKVARDDRIWNQVIAKGIRLIRYGLTYLLGGGFRDIYYAVKLFIELMKFSKKKYYDLVISISFPFYVHIALAVFSLFNKNIKVLVADCGDPFYCNPAISKAFYFKYIERWVMRRFDYVTVPVESAVQAYRHCNIEERIKFIPQGFKLLDISDDLYTPNSIPTFCYAGVFYKKTRNPEYFFQYLATLKQKFCFVVYALNDTFTLSILNKYKKILKDRLVIEAPVNRDTLIYEMAKMDFVINFDNDNMSQRPSKLIDYAMSKRPILSFNRCTFKASVFNDFLRGIYAEQFKVDLQKYDIKNVVNSFLSLVEKK